MSFKDFQFLNRIKDDASACSRARCNLLVVFVNFLRGLTVSLTVFFLAMGVVFEVWRNSSRREFIFVSISVFSQVCFLSALFIPVSTLVTTAEQSRDFNFRYYWIRWRKKVATGPADVIADHRLPISFVHLTPGFTLHHNLGKYTNRYKMNASL